MTARIISFKIDEHDLEKIDKLTIRLGISRSQFIKNALQLYIDIIENTPKITRDSLPVTLNQVLDRHVQYLEEKKMTEELKDLIKCIHIISMNRKMVTKVGTIPILGR